MDVENVLEKNINLAIKHIDVNELAINFESVRDESFKENMQELLQKLKDDETLDIRTETFEEVSDGGLDQ